MDGLTGMQLADNILDAMLFGTLAGLSLVAAALLFSARQSIRDAIARLRGALVPDSEPLIINLERELGQVNEGGKYLLRGFYVFLGSLLMVLGFVDTWCEAWWDGLVLFDIIDVALTGLSFGGGLYCIVKGAGALSLLFGTSKKSDREDSPKE